MQKNRLKVVIFAVNDAFIISILGYIVLIRNYTTVMSQKTWNSYHIQIAYPPYKLYVNEVSKKIENFYAENITLKLPCFSKFFFLITILIFDKQ